MYADVNRSVAAIGAIITILSLTIDPFVQQIIGFKVRQVQTSTIFGTIPQATQYSKGTQIIIEAAGTVSPHCRNSLC